MALCPRGSALTQVDEGVERGRPMTWPAQGFEKVQRLGLRLCGERRVVSEVALQRQVLHIRQHILHQQKKERQGVREAGVTCRP
jgi:hypothetical protein